MSSRDVFKINYVVNGKIELSDVVVGYKKKKNIKYCFS